MISSLSESRMVSWILPTAVCLSMRTETSSSMLGNLGIGLYFFSGSWVCKSLLKLMAKMAME